MKVDKKMEKRWEIESAMSTLQRAEDIKKNAKHLSRSIP